MTYAPLDGTGSSAGLRVLQGASPKCRAPDTSTILITTVQHFPSISLNKPYFLLISFSIECSVSALCCKRKNLVTALVEGSGLLRLYTVYWLVLINLFLSNCCCRPSIAGCISTVLYLTAYVFSIGHAYRKCDVNGTWFSLENRTWVNYSECLRFMTTGKERGKVHVHLPHTLS